MRKRNKQINIRLTESEYLSFTKKAELSNLTLQDFVIQSCSNKEIHVIQGAEDLASIRAELKKQEIISIKLQKKQILWESIQRI